MGFKDEMEIKTAEDIVREQLDEELLSEELPKAEASEEKAEEPAESAEEAKESEEEKDTVAEKVSESESESEKKEADIIDKPKKRQCPFQVPVLIAMFIVLGALLGYFIFTSFLLHEPEGLWMTQDEDGNTYYYEFKQDSSCVMTIGSIDNIGAYYKTKADTGNTIYINQYYGMLAGEYNYTVSGSRLFKNQKMTLDYNGYNYELTQVSSKDMHLEIDKEFVPKEELLGDWEYEIPEYGVSYLFTFNKDGTMVYNQADTVYYNATYSVDDDYVHMHFYSTEEQNVDLEYTLDGDTLVLMDLECHRVGAKATADEA